MIVRDDRILYSPCPPLLPPFSPKDFFRLLPLFAVSEALLAFFSPAVFVAPVPFDRLQDNGFGADAFLFNRLRGCEHLVMAAVRKT